MTPYSFLTLAWFIALWRTTSGLPYVTVQSQFSDNTVRYKTWEADDAWPCETGSRHHTGWADIKDRHLFFWFHEARNSSKNTPLLLWFQGGPGGSSLHGSFVENGPCLVDTPNSAIPNPYSWTEQFNIVYLDQPAGVGFSYLDHPDDEESYHQRSEVSALDVVTFIRLLYEAFPHLANLDLHLSGESYAGRYVPTIADAILDYNEFFVAGGNISMAIPLRSLMIGNPWLNPAIQMPALYDVSCFPYRGTYPPFMNESLCQNALALADRCESLLDACALASNRGEDSLLCSSSVDICYNQYYGTFMNATSSIYDRRLTGCPDAGSCYDGMLKTIDFLQSKSVMHDHLQVYTQSNGTKTSWDMINEIIERRYIESGDYVMPSTLQMQRLLNYARNNKSSSRVRSLDILIYAGVADIACNTEGVLSTLNGLRWEGRREFNGIPWRELASRDGESTGRVKRVPNLWMVEFNDAGHMVPFDQPEAMLQSTGQWLEHLSEGAAATSDSLDMLLGTEPSVDQDQLPEDILIKDL
ncbi:hypothetical protein BHE90_002971 [Fusarium euwallaceae]|uniref:Carboxypeptidase n=1 Tax=Fusarium euwallaceae TaxID=1147111 RepID=A0A430M3P6_9HYPO|nr:hypothetical protein BHE90_002971 [Fusarium euwallaceae]